MEKEISLNQYKHQYNMYCSFDQKFVDSVIDNRMAICEYHKERAFKVLNEEEKEIFMKTVFIEITEFWGLQNEKQHNPLRFLTNSSIDFLNDYKRLLLNQIKELETIISMNEKLEKFYESELNKETKSDWT